MSSFDLDIGSLYSGHMFQGSISPLRYAILTAKL